MENIINLIHKKNNKFKLIIFIKRQIKILMLIKEINIKNKIKSILIFIN